MATAKDANIHAALLACQKLYPEIPKHGHFDLHKKTIWYAYLADLLSAVVPIWTDHGILLQRDIEYDDNGQMFLRVTLNHVASDTCLSAKGPLGMIGMSHKELGSAITYMSRYLIQLYIGVAPDDDDDQRVVTSTGKPPSETIDGQEQLTIATLLEAGGGGTDGFCDKHKIKDLSELPKEKFAAAVRQIERRNAAKAREANNERPEG